MDPLIEIKKILICPTHKKRLRVDPIVFSTEGVPWPDASIYCPEGCIYSIDKGIPRFVPQDNYASAFGLQWKRYPKTQLDSYTGQPISRQRLERCLGAPIGELKSKIVLECGSGAGRFTELLIDNCKLLVALDLSEAVDANLKNCGRKKPYILCQADINKSPLPRQFFDVVICLGVIQHAPSPEHMIASLAEHLRPGGLLVIDHYTLKSPLERLGSFLTLAYPIRAILKRLRPELALKVTIGLTAICDPIRKHTSKLLWVDRIACRIFPSFCYYDTYPSVHPDIVYEWNELDTHDGLTDYYKHFRTPEEIRYCLQRLGFSHIKCSYGGNGVEARAILTNGNMPLATKVRMPL
jgi:SAM-dependent methyltransferase